MHCCPTCTGGSGTRARPEAPKLLLTVAHDIEKALAKDDTSGVAPEPVVALAVRLEAEHPSLAGVLRQIMDTLGRPESERRALRDCGACYSANCSATYQ